MSEETIKIIDQMKVEVKAFKENRLLVFDYKAFNQFKIEESRHKLTTLFDLLIDSLEKEITPAIKAEGEKE